MANLRQKKLAEKTIEAFETKAFTPMYSLLMDSGYPETTAKGAAKVVFSGQGYKDSLEKLLKGRKIDKNSRLQRLADIFYSGDSRAALGANDQITKILGEYSPIKQEVTEIKDKREEIVKPE